MPGIVGSGPRRVTRFSRWMHRLEGMRCCAEGKRREGPVAQGYATGCLRELSEFPPHPAFRSPPRNGGGISFCWRRRLLLALFLA